MSNENRRVTGEGYGYVYIMSYPGSDKVKIGHAVNVTKRAKDIGGTFAPEQPVIEASFWCAERREVVERAAHKAAKFKRHNGEWFSLTVDQAMAIIKSASQSVRVGCELVFDRAGWEAKEAERAAEIAAAQRASVERAEARRVTAQKEAAERVAAARELMEAQAAAARRDAAKAFAAEREAAKRQAAAQKEAAERQAIIKKKKFNIIAVVFFISLVVGVLGAIATGVPGDFVSFLILSGALCSMPASVYYDRQCAKDTKSWRQEAAMHWQDFIAKGARFRLFAHHRRVEKRGREQ